MIQLIRKSKWVKAIITLMLLSFFNQFIFIDYSHALTGGPSQPEVQSFEPVSTSEMVDVFSGDFVYNIPLLDVGGYPINISYHSGVSMDQEASWVGLGWNINPGCISRNMRGIPDDYDADTIIKKNNMRPNQTFRLGIGYSLEFFGIGVQPSFGIQFNNYKGLGVDYSVGLGVGPLGLDIGYGSQSGMDIGLDLSFSKRMNDAGSGSETGNNASLKGSISLGYNSRIGLKDLCFSTQASSTSTLARNLSGGCEYSFAQSTYVPSITPGMTSTAVSVNIKLGLSAYGADPSIPITASYNEQRLKEKIQRYPAYGYLYSEAGSDNEKGMMDFNREKDGSFNKFTRNLPLTNFTYDVYTVTGQGTGGMFRPFRGNMGAVGDPLVENGRSSCNIGSVNASIEIGLSPSVKIGGNIDLLFSTGHSGRWRDNTISNNLKFKGKVANSEYEPCYFKNAGEKTLVDKNFYNGMGKGQVSSPTLDNNTTTNIVYPYIPKRGVRDKRNQMISYMTSEDANYFGFQKEILNTHIDSITGKQKVDSISRISEYHKKKHISEITTINPDGTTYVYGIPAYNTKQIEATFNTAGNRHSAKYTTYDTNEPKDNSINNRKGTDYYFNSTEMPPYAHSYLLTAVLSSDYVDLRGDGPTDDDLGSYTYFGYERKNKNYNWRLPYDSANYAEGLKSDNTDDKGSYVYGQKEVWYLRTISTKTHIAEFYLSDRQDCYEVRGENGGKRNGHMQKLDSILLFSKADRIKNGKNAIPIKTVYFEYNYELCPNVENNSGNIVTVNNVNINQNKGKLTLKKIWFRYRKNSKGRLSPYVFVYNSLNPSYDIKSYDRWGNYKRNQSPLSNADFPYVDQSSRDTADSWSAAWSLTDINLPSGGKIQVNYEADDYGYVQDKAAMQMFKIYSMGSNKTFQTNPDKNLYFNGTENKFIFFKLASPLSSDQEVRKLYFQGIDKLYFNCLVNLLVDGANDNNEYIAGYAEIKSCGLADGNSNYGYVELAPVATKDNGGGSEVNPISKAAWQYLRLNLPFLVHPAEDLHKSTTTSFAKMSDLLLGSVYEIKSMINGYYEDLHNRQFASSLKTDKSWIRLLNPAKKKIGGGVRVKSLHFSDEWSSMTTTENSTEYGQEYDYTMTEKQPDGSNMVISSGVASYEPTIGGDENPFRQPLTYKEKINLAPDNILYQEAPMGESFFPSPQVGYRQVTVRNLHNEEIKRHGTGKTVHEFFTAYDFPTLTYENPIQVKVKKPGYILSFLGLKKTELATASQGYVIELNDMHGKPKAEWTYAEDGKEYLTGVRYYYKVDNENAVRQHLNNNVTILKKDGHYVDNELIGIEFESVADLREKEEKNIKTSCSLNLDAFALGFIPIIVPVTLGPMSYTHNRVRTAVVTKVINRYGLLDKTVAYDGGAQLETQNVAYDGETGEVLLTKTQNEYGDFMFNLNYPAHWAYDNMGPAYKNTGIELNATVSGGIINDSRASSYLVPGDEIRLSSDNNRYWVLDVDKTTHHVSIIDRYGINPVLSNSTITVTVLRSGHRNQQSLSIGSVSSRKTPFNYALNTFNNFSEVMDAKAIEYSDNWQMNRGTDFQRCKCKLTVYGRDYGILMDSLARKGKFSVANYDLVNESAFINSSLYSYFNMPNHMVMSNRESMLDNVITGFYIKDKIVDILTGTNNNIYVVYNVFSGNTSTGFGILKFNHFKDFKDIKEYTLASGLTSMQINKAKIINEHIVLAGECTDGSSNTYATASTIDTMDLANYNNKRINIAGTKAFNVTYGNDTMVFIGSYNCAGIKEMLLFKTNTSISSIGRSRSHYYSSYDILDAPMSLWITGSTLSTIVNTNNGISYLALKANLNVPTSGQGHFFTGLTASCFDNERMGVLSNDKKSFSVLSYSNQQLSGNEYYNIYHSRFPVEFGLVNSANSDSILKLTTIKDYSISGSYKGSYGVPNGFLLTNGGGTINLCEVTKSDDIAFNPYGTSKKMTFGMNQEVDNNGQMKLSGKGLLVYNDNETGACNTWPINYNFRSISYSSNPIDPNSSNVTPVFSTISTTVTSGSPYIINYCSGGGGGKMGDCVFNLRSFSSSSNLGLQDMVSFSNIRPIPADTGCSEKLFNFLIDGKTSDNTTIVFQGMCCFPIGTCSMCGVSSDSIINPYVQGVRGNWRAKRSYVYYDKTVNNSTRKQSGNNNLNQTDTRKDGTYSNFVPFWTTTGSGEWQPPANLNTTSNSWTWQSEVTKYSPYGFEVENMDRLGIYSSALYGYYNKLPLAVASNARYRQIACDGFEDYESTDTADFDKCKAFEHWNFKESLTIASLSADYAHSGLRSLKIGQGYVSVIREINNKSDETRSGFLNNFILKPQDDLGLFSPDAGKYILSYWIMPGDTSDISFVTPVVTVVVNRLAINLPLSNMQNIAIVEGWKRFEQKFTIPSGATSITVTFINHASRFIYLDDVRIHPFNSNMKTFVYDPVTLKLMAQLDENNYATFYEYDEEGLLIRVKQETERGIVTLKETRQNIHKKDKPAN